VLFNGLFFNWFALLRLTLLLFLYLPLLFQPVCSSTRLSFNGLAVQRAYCSTGLLFPFDALVA
jgi:hypothetical protein